MVKKIGYKKIAHKTFMHPQLNVKITCLWKTREVFCTMENEKRK
jgi:hypothetical protein